ncbi:hypothetical protein H2200_012442 [Cladophialophora chaetospira]|uniref:Sphingoid long-chain base transporter RSB1 n=1 Tax=Cladophialophora chaetospira TaxID=386627 RepID=A0AA38WXX8_9EURO|nr:hypothetical protein H2200_012442 [Cladophialophora chaetospira]
MSNPSNLVSFGPDANCTLSLCPVSATVYGYRPSIAANVVFLVLYGLCLIFNIAQLVRHRSWTFSISCILGCICEMLGYGGRILLYQNPFDFNGFMLQITCITFAPVFYCAAIYVTLTKIVNFLGPQYSRLPPNAYYWIFIPCDLVSLALQGTGGGMSTTSSGSSQVGVNIAIAGLSFQVFTLLCFIGLCLAYALSYRRHGGTFPRAKSAREFKIFIGLLSFAMICILIRCIYRIDELSEGYSGPLIGDEGLFIGLEGVMVVLAAFALNAVLEWKIKAMGKASGGSSDDKDVTIESSGNQETGTHGKAMY